MPDEIYPQLTVEIARHRRALAPETAQSFHEFGREVFADGVLTKRMKHVIATAVAHVTQCPYCIRGHTQAALREGATSKELMEAIWVAIEMRAGAGFAHSALALAEIEQAVGFDGDNRRLDQETPPH